MTYWRNELLARAQQCCDIRGEFRGPFVMEFVAMIHRFARAQKKGDTEPGPDLMLHFSAQADEWKKRPIPTTSTATPPHAVPEVPLTSLQPAQPTVLSPGISQNQSPHPAYGQQHLKQSLNSFMNQYFAKMPSPNLDVSLSSELINFINSSQSSQMQGPTAASHDTTLHTPLHTPVTSTPNMSRPNGNE